MNSGHKDKHGILGTAVSGIQNECYLFLQLLLRTNADFLVLKRFFSDGLAFLVAHLFVQRQLRRVVDADKKFLIGLYLGN
jgi:hypothetical protein